MDKLSEHFNKILFPDIIKPAISVALKHTDKNYVNNVNLTTLMNESEYAAKLSKLYEEKREWLKKIYFSSNKDCYEQKNDNEVKLLDMHKIAAIIARCILALKPFAFYIDKANEYIKLNNKLSNFNWLSCNYLINYKLAVDVAMLINLNDAIDKSDRINNSIDRKQLIDDFVTKGFDYYDNPILTSEHESFYNSLIINMAINDINGRDFDYLGFATNCFQLQQYSALKYLSDK